jgi:hypothetical protein
MKQNKQTPKLSWLDRAIYTARYHSSCVVERKQLHTINDTAKLLNRSVGSVAEDLKIVSWLKTHPDQIRKFKHAKDALAFIRAKAKTMRNDVSHLD